MSCRSYECSGDDDSQLKEGFNAGTPPYLGYSGYPGSDFPSSCNGSVGYGGYGHYGTYGGCATQDHYDYDNSNAGAHAELDAHNNVHEPGCWCPQCQAPYSMPYHVNQSACNNPYCKCGDCDGNCKCGGGAAPAIAVHGGANGHNPNALFDFGLTNGSGLKGHVVVPGLNIHVDFKALLRYAVLILIISTIAYYFLGLRLR